MAKQYYDRSAIVFADKPTDPRFKDLTGKTFERLLVLGFAGTERRRRSSWFCECDCGKIIKTTTDSLRAGSVQSCTCLRLETTTKRLTIHGQCKSPEAKIYYTIRQRCENPKNPRYRRYGGRGITLNLTLEEFLKEVGQRPSPRHSIDRVDNNKPYQKGNLRWATNVEQANNRVSNHTIEFGGEKKTLAEWSKEQGIPVARLGQRIVLLGWCPVHALTAPLNTKRPKDCAECNQLKL